MIIFDLDGVIFKHTNFWMELHKKFNTLEQGRVLTEKYLHTDYNKLVEEVVYRLWKGKDAAPYYKLVNSIPYINGVKETFERIDEETAIISASTLDLAKRAQKDLRINYLYANELVIENNKIAGFKANVGAGEKKAEIIRELRLISPNIIYIGDSDNDIEAFKEADIAIGFNPTEKLREFATYCVYSDNLSDVLKNIA